MQQQGTQRYVPGQLSSLSSSSEAARPRFIRLGHHGLPNQCSEAAVPSGASVSCAVRRLDMVLKNWFPNRDVLKAPA